MNNKHYSSHKIICWQVSRFCNRSCNFCVSSSGPSIQHPNRCVKKCLERFKILGVEKLSISGGEPLLYPKIEDIIKYSYDLGIKVIVTTNGDPLLYNQPDYLNMFEYVKISVHGNNYLHNQFTFSGHFEKLCDVILKLSNQSIKIGINYIIYDNSYECLNVFFDTMRNIGVNNILLLTFIQTNNNSVNDRFKSSDDLIPKTIKVANNWKNKFPGGIKIHNFSLPQFYIIVSDNEDVIIPMGSRLSHFVACNIFDDIGRFTNLELIKTKDIFTKIWNSRLLTDAIISL